MAPRPRKKSLTEPTSPKLLLAHQPTSNLPAAIRFPLAVVINLSLSTLLYTLAAPFIGDDLKVAAHGDIDWSKIGLLIFCQAAQLAVGWWCNFDGYDVSALTVLSRFPKHFLLSSYYYVRPSTVVASLVIDVISVCVPFSILRSASATHKPNAPRGAIANRAIITDLPTQVLVSALSSGAFALVYSAFCWTKLPTWLAVNFDGIPSIVAAYEAQYILLFLMFLPIGIASKIFLFTPSIGARPDKTDTERAQFDPVTATLWETVWYNAWGYSTRERILIERTFILAYAVLSTSVVEIFATIAGTTLEGALVWGSIFAVGSVVSGAFLFWVGQVDEVKN